MFTWYAEKHESLKRWTEKEVFEETGIQARKVWFKIPRDRIFETDGGNANGHIQKFESNQLPEYVQGSVEGISQVSGKSTIAISLQPLEFEKNSKLELYGAYGWKTGISILDRFCDTICKQEGVLFARSMMLSDIIGEDWKCSMYYTFEKNQYSIESFLKGKQEKAGTTRRYPTWKGSKYGEYGRFDECIYEEMSLENLNFWIATRAVMPVDRFEGGHEGLLYSIGNYDNGHICMDSGLFGTNGRELGFKAGMNPRMPYMKKEHEWSAKNRVRPIVFVKQQAFYALDGPIIIPSN